MLKSPDTNLMILKPTRKPPKRGDLFVCNVLGERWLAGRVIRVDAALSCVPKWEQERHVIGIPDDVLIYIYQDAIASPDEIRLPLEPRLLIPPEITNRLAWRRGVFMTVQETVLQPEEILPQHCFVAHDSQDNEYYVDEDGYRLPGRSEPCQHSGLVSYRWIDDRISEALGIPLFPEEDDAMTSCGRREVILYLPEDSEVDLGLDEIEGPLGAALKTAHAGKLEGHGYHIGHKRHDIRFNGPKPELIAEVIVPLLNQMPLPAGSFLVVGGKTPRRIDLRPTSH
jgi:hypothetical protein